MNEVLPPALELSERARTVAGDGEKWHAVKKTVVNRVEIDPDTHVRLIRATACRLVQEGDTVQLYYSTENSREFKEVEVGIELAPAVEHLIGEASCGRIGGQDEGGGRPLGTGNSHDQRTFGSSL